MALTLARCRGADLRLLDEPTAGLDPAAADEVLQALVRHAASDGMTMLFSSHQLSEMDMPTRRSDASDLDGRGSRACEDGADAE